MKYLIFMFIICAINCSAQSKNPNPVQPGWEFYGIRFDDGGSSMSTTCREYPQHFFMIGSEFAEVVSFDSWTYPTYQIDGCLWVESKVPEFVKCCFVELDSGKKKSVPCKAYKLILEKPGTFESIPVAIIKPEQQTGFHQPPDHIFMDFTYLKKPTRKQLKACGSGSVIPIYVNMPDGAKVVSAKFSNEASVYYYIVPVFKKIPRA